MRVPLALLILAISACSADRRGSGRPRDIGPRVDVGATTDGSEPKDGSDPSDASEPSDGAELDGSDPIDGSQPDTSDPRDAGAPDSDPIDATAPDGGTPSDSGLPPLCTQVCTTPSDCTQGNNALQDADNWACTNGACQYLGCLSDLECTTVFSAPYTCALFPGFTVPACVEACNDVSDCESPSPLFGTDNYECNNGGCRWLGCNNSTECQQTFNDPSYVCEPQAGLQFPNCVRPCSDPIECGAATSPAFDADNYACTNARCQYLGCNDNAECQGSFMNGSWECR